MGAKQTTALGKDLLDLDDWIQTPLSSYTKNNDPYYSSNFTVLTHKTKKNQQLEKYDLFFNGPAQYRTYYESFQWRKSLSSVVTARYLKQITKRDICATFYCAAIYIQRIPIRLYQIVDIPIQEGIYVLRSALQGFSMIFQKTGYFDVSPQLICINREGKVKVWANKNLSKNHPQFSTINHNKDQSQFIQRIISIVQESTDFQQNSKFSDFLGDRLSIVKFENIFGFLTDYIKQERIHSTREMGSILELYIEKQKAYENAQSNSNFGHKITKTRKSVFKVKNTQPQQNPFRTMNAKEEMKVGRLNMNFKNKRHLNTFISDRNPHEHRPHQNLNNSKNLTPKKNTDGSFHGSLYGQQKSKNYYSYSNDISLDNQNFAINERTRNNYTPIAFYYKNSGLSSPQNNQRSFQFTKKVSYNSNTSRSQQNNQMQHSHQLKYSAQIGKQVRRFVNTQQIKHNQSNQVQQTISDFSIQKPKQYKKLDLGKNQQRQQNLHANSSIKKQSAEQQIIKLQKNIENSKIQSDSLKVQPPLKQVKEQRYSPKKQRSKAISPSTKSKKQIKKVQYYSNDQYCEIDPQIAKDLEIYQ